MSLPEFEKFPEYQKTVRELEERYTLQKLHRGTGRTNFIIFLGSEKTSGDKRILKVGPREGIKKELSGHQRLADYLPIPQIVEFSNNYISIEYLDGKTLHDVIKGQGTTPDMIASIHRDLASRLLRLWSSTKRAFNPQETVYNHTDETRKRLSSILDFLQNEIKFPAEKQIVINGQIFPSLETTLQEALVILHDAPYSILDPGDTNPQNIIMAPNHTKWWIIDLEKTGRYDPAYILARHLNQWGFYVRNVLKLIPTLKTDSLKNTLNISYDKQLIVGVQDLIESTLILCKESAVLLGDPTLFQRLSYYSLLFYLRFTADPTSWLFKYIRPKLVPVFIAEGIKSLYRYQR